MAFDIAAALAKGRADAQREIVIENMIEARKAVDAPKRTRRRPQRPAAPPFDPTAAIRLADELERHTADLAALATKIRTGVEMLATPVLLDICDEGARTAMSTAEMLRASVKD